MIRRALFGLTLALFLILTPISTWAQSEIGFNPTGATSLSVTTSSANVALPSTAGNAFISNVGSSTAYIKFGTGSVTAATTDFPIPAGYSVVYSRGQNTHIAAITAASTASLLITTGQGLPYAAGGGGSGGGGGGASDITSWAGVALGAPSAYGTSPGAVTVPGVNAYVTNAGVAQDSTTLGQTGALVQLSTLTSPGSYTTAKTNPFTGTREGAVRMALQGSADTGNGITPVISSAAESNKVIKNSAGNLYKWMAKIGATPGNIILYNGTSAPSAGGAAISGVCYDAPANSTVGDDFPFGDAFSTGLVLVFSTTGCLTNTASSTVLFSGWMK